MSQAPVKIAILVFPETSGSVVYGLYDLLAGAGIEWNVITRGTPGPRLIRPLLVARKRTPININNGVRLRPDATLRDCPDVEFICIPEVNVRPGEPLAERFREEIAWIAERHRQGAALAASCSGAMLFAEAGLLDGREATTHWAWCDAMQARFPAVQVNRQRALVVSGEGQRLIMRSEERV